MIIKQEITNMILFDFLSLKGKMILFAFASVEVYSIWFTFDQSVSPQHLLYQIKHPIFVRCLVVVTAIIKWGRVVPSGYGSLSIWLYQYDFMLSIIVAIAIEQPPRWLGIGTPKSRQIVIGY